MKSCMYEFSDIGTYFEIFWLRKLLKLLSDVSTETELSLGLF